MSSCELLASAPTTPRGEAKTSALHQSLPNLAKHSEKLVGDADEETTPRRFTVTVIDLKKFKFKNRKAVRHSDSSLPEQSPKTTLALPVQVRRSSSCQDFSSEEAKSRRAVSRHTWLTTSLQKSRRNTASVSGEAELPSRTPPITAAENDSTVTKKKKTKAEKMLSLIFPLSRSSSFRSVKSNDLPLASPVSPQTPQTNKKAGRIFSFRSKNASKTASIDTPRVKLRANTDIHSLSSVTLDTPSDASDKSNQFATDQNLSIKIEDITRRLTGDGSISPSHLASPAPISKGIVSRLSKRFARRDKDKEEKKVSQLSSTQSKSINFLNARSKFEMQNSNDTKTSSLGGNFNCNNNLSVTA